MGTKEEKHLHMDTDEDKQLAMDTKQETKPQVTVFLPSYMYLEKSRIFHTEVNLSFDLSIDVKLL